MEQECMGMEWTNHMGASPELFAVSEEGLLAGEAWPRNRGSNMEYG